MDRSELQIRPPSSESLTAGYETSGVNVRALAGLVVALIVSAIAIHAAAWFIFMAFLKADESHAQPYSAIASEQPQSMPDPRIQPSPPTNTLPREDLQAMYRSEDQVFMRMGWKIDPATHSQLEIPSNVISAVVEQQQKRNEHSH